FEGGLADPMLVRSGVLEGLEEAVEVPDGLPEPRPVPERPGFVAGLDEIGGEDLGLLDCPALDDALDGIDGTAGGVRDGLGRAAWIYATRVGPAAVDVAALAARLAEVGRRHRSAEEVEGYGLE